MYTQSTYINYVSIFLGFIDMEQKTEDLLCNIFFSIWCGILGIILWGIIKWLN